MICFGSKVSVLSGRHSLLRNFLQLRKPLLKILPGCFLIFFSLISLASETKDKKPIFLAQSGPPPGFEDLLEPQTTAIDIYYGQRYLVTTLATYTPNFLELHTPQQVINLIPDILDQKKILKALSEPLLNNASLICHGNRTTNCGSLTPEIAGVIFNPDEFRANIFINPLFLAVSNAMDDKYLPPSMSDWSFIQMLNGSLSGQTEQDDHYSISGISTVGKYQRRFQSQWVQSDTSNLYLETLNYEENYQQYLFQGGLFRSQSYGLNFISQQRIFGGNASTTLETRTDLAIARGSEIQVFFSSRSRVEIYKDDRLIDTGFYDIGNQILDTSRFPEGSYNVILKILEDSGGEREETIFFSKSRRLPPIGSPQYFIELGNVILDHENNFFPELSKAWALRSGYSKRLSNKIGLSAGGLITNEILLTELGVFHFGLNYDIESSLMISSKKDTGLLFNSHYRIGNFSTYLNYRQVSSGEDTDLDPLAPLEPLDQWDPVPLSTTQSNMGINATIGSGSLSFQYRINESDNQESQNGYSLRYMQGFRTKSSMSLQFSAEISDFDNGSRLLFGLQLIHQKNRWSNNFQSNYESQEDELGESNSGLTLSGSSRWSDGEKFDSDVRATLRAGHVINRDYVGGDIVYDSSKGASNFAIENGSDNGNGYTLYTGNASFSFAKQKNNFAFGGSKINNSAVIIDLTGQAKDASFDVYINNQKHSRIKAGRRSIITLPPFRTYYISLKATSSVNSFVEFDNKPEVVTLYPGNVHYLSWHIDKLVIVYGMVSNSSGEAIKNARIEGAKGLAFSNKAGVFQAEIGPETDILDFKTTNEKCYVNIPSLPTDQSMVNLGKLICH